MSTSPITAEDASHLGPLLRMRPNVAERYDADTRTERVAHLRRTTLLGLVFYNLYNITNVVLMPDVLALGVFLRVGIVTPLGLGLVGWYGRVGPAWRERGALLGSVAAVFVPIFLLGYSKSPLAVYTVCEAPLTMMFATMMLVLRFPHAVAFVALGVLMGIAANFLRPGVEATLAATLSFQALTAGTFVLYGNYRLEERVRRSYLQSLAVTLQAASLRVDNRVLERLSLVDSLTGIANRRHFSERLQAWTSETGGGGRAMGLIMVDVDHFKAYNDHYGHPAGDSCLRDLAAAMSACLRDDRDLLTRYGGEEFAALLPDVDLPALCAVARRLCLVVEALGLAHAHRGDGCAVVTVSVGVALAEPGARSRGPEQGGQLLAAADAALYEAKRTGRNRYAVGALTADGRTQRGISSVEG